MSYAILLYLYTVLTGLSYLAASIIFLLAIASAFFIALLATDYEKNNIKVQEAFNKVFKKPLKWLLPICIAIVLLVPTKDELYFIVGGSALITVGTTEEAKKLPDNVLKAANTFLEKLQENKK